MALVLRKESYLAGDRHNLVGTYVGSSIADPNAHRNDLDGQDSKVIQDGVTFGMH